LVTSVPEHTRTLSLETLHTAFEWNVRGWLFPEFSLEVPLDNCTATIIMNKHVYIYIDSDSKTNSTIILFPQNGCNFRIKAFHILNAPPFCDDFISLLKRVFSSKLAARVSDFNRLHFLLVLSFAVSISNRSFHCKCNISSSSCFSFFIFFFFFIFFIFYPKLPKFTGIYFFIEDSTVMIVKWCWLEITY